MLHPMLLLLLTAICELVHCYICPIQYEPNNYISDLLNFVDFDGSPLLYGDDYSDIPTAFNYWAIANNSIGFIGNVLETTTQLPFALISNTAYPIPAAEGSGLVISARFRYEGSLISENITSPLGYDQDPGYACAILGAQLPGPALFWAYFWVTNTKVYAIYGYLSYYVIPVANRDPSDYATYSIVFESRTTTSWRIDNREVLRIGPRDQPIDPRLLVSGDPSAPVVITPPGSVYVLFGNFEYGSSLTNVCQRALFNQCSQRLRNAVGTNCQYAPTMQSFDWNFSQISEWAFLSIANYTRLDECPAPDNCQVRGVTCPQVKPARCQNRRPVISTTTRTTTTRQPTSTTTNAAPTTTRNPCGCNFDLHF